VVGALPPKTTARDAAQLLVDQWDQRFACSLIPLAPIEKELCDLRRRRSRQVLAPACASIREITQKITHEAANVKPL
jgi:hypothetical protein